ncbi:hypothetical protein ACWEOS_10020 [Micromonospora taraxaci]
MRLDWGNVPGWLAAGSLLLAFRVFLRDRTTSERSQVDLLGIWWEIDRPFRFAGEPIIEEVRFKTFVRNGSDLPIEVTNVAWKVKTRWMMPEGDSGEPWGNYPGNAPIAWAIEPADRSTELHLGPLRVPPQKTIEGEWQVCPLADLTPEGADQLDFSPDGVHFALEWAVVTDNAGRRWLTKHQQGRPARRIRWHSVAVGIPWIYKGKGAKAVIRSWVRAKEMTAAAVAAVAARVRQRKVSKSVDVPDQRSALDATPREMNDNA